MSKETEVGASWAPDRIWLQREQGENGSHTWCEDPVGDGDMVEEVAYVRADGVPETILLDFKSALTPYGMLVRALRIVGGTTLHDMAKHLGSTPAVLSAVEVGRKPVTRALIRDTYLFFIHKGIPDTLLPLQIAAGPAASGGDQA